MVKKNDYRTDTLLSLLGRNAEGHKGVVNTPVHHGSTLLFESLESLKIRRQDPYAKGYSSYGRSGTPTTFALEEAVAHLEGGYGAIAVQSGLGAIVGTVLAFVSHGDHILVSDSVYPPHRNFCEGLLARMGVEAEFYDPTIGAGIAKLMRPETKVVFLESPGSFSFEVQDIPAIAAAARAGGAVSVIDNSWATPLFLKPLALGIDISVHAATKYIVGHSDAMMGLIVTGEAHYKKVRAMTGQLGYSAAPDDVYLALRGLRTLSVRLARHNQTGLELAKWFQERPEVERVIHPALPDHPGHEIWRRDFTGASGLFSVVFRPCSDTALAAMIDGLALFGLGASWGGFESLALPGTLADKRTATTWDAPGPIVRIHAGLEDPKDLIADMAAGLDRMTAVKNGGA